MMGEPIEVSTLGKGGEGDFLIVFFKSSAGCGADLNLKQIHLKGFFLRRRRWLWLFRHFIQDVFEFLKVLSKRYHEIALVKSRGRVEKRKEDKFG